MIKKKIIRNNPRNEHIPYVFINLNKEMRNESLELVESLKSEIKKLESSQIRRVFNILRDTNNAEELLNFIQKQIDRFEDKEESKIYIIIQKELLKFKDKYKNKFIEFLQMFTYEVLLYKKCMEDK